MQSLHALALMLALVFFGTLDIAIFGSIKNKSYEKYNQMLFWISAIVCILGFIITFALLMNFSFRLLLS